MKRFAHILILLLAVLVEATAQNTMFNVAGTVRDAKTGKRLSQASITTQNGKVATVTNADGKFTIKSSMPIHEIWVSCLGYSAVKVNIDKDNANDVVVKLSPGTIMLSELIVSNMNAREIVEMAVDKIPNNFSRNNELLRCFYRETTQKGKRFIYVAEAVTDIYKGGYNRLTGVDRVAIEKGRKLMNVRQTDTLGAKIQGGPTLPVALDLMKNREILLSREELDLYNFTMDIPVTIDGRPQLVIDFHPAFVTDHVLYHGKMYVDRQNLAFTRIVMSMDMSNEEAATKAMLLHKPNGVRFRPKELTTTVAYRFDGEVSRMHYLKSDVRFYCDWKRKLFAQPFHVEAEMVVTDLMSQDATPIKHKNSFSMLDSFYDKVEFFADPSFWDDYNIIEPTESLEHAIHKLKKNQADTPSI